MKLSIALQSDTDIKRLPYQKNKVLNYVCREIQKHSFKTENAENRFSIHAKHRMFENFEKVLVIFFILVPLSFFRHLSIVLKKELRKKLSVGSM